MCCAWESNRREWKPVESDGESILERGAKYRQDSTKRASGRKWMCVCVWERERVYVTGRKWERERECDRKKVRERGIERGSEQILLDLSQLCTNKVKKKKTFQKIFGLKMSVPGRQDFRLTWVNYSQKLTESFHKFLTSEILCNVTLWVHSKTSSNCIKAHQVLKS